MSTKTQGAWRTVEHESRTHSSVFGLMTTNARETLDLLDEEGFCPSPLGECLPAPIFADEVPTEVDALTLADLLLSREE